MMNQWKRYELRIDGEKRGDFDSLDDVFVEIDDAFYSKPDFYSGVLSYSIEDFGDPHQGVPVRVVGDTMAGGLWEACCENSGVFAMWLDIVGWRPTEPARKPTEDESAGMTWWNGLSDGERRRWLDAAGSAVPADAWKAFKRSL